MKKIAKYVIVILALILFVVSGKYAFSYIYNEWIRSEYDSENYSVDTEPLFFINCFEPYIAYYNEGNISYQKEDYVAAIEDYKQALELNPPESKECSIRVNLSLAMIYNLDDNYASPEKIEDTIALLKEARDVLLEEGCANNQGDGHDATAQKLKEEIDEFIKQLEQQQQSQSQNNNEENPEETTEENSEDEYEEDIKEQLQQSQSEALEEREDNLEDYENLNGGYNYDYDGIW